MNKFYIYFIHEDGDMMLFAGESDNGVVGEPPATYRFTPHHRVTKNNMPVLYHSAVYARQTANELEAAILDRRLSLFVGAWNSISHVRTNPHGKR